MSLSASALHRGKALSKLAVPQFDPIVQREAVQGFRFPSIAVQALVNANSSPETVHRAAVQHRGGLAARADVQLPTTFFLSAATYHRDPYLKKFLSKAVARPSATSITQAHLRAIVDALLRNGCTAPLYSILRHVSRQGITVRVAAPASGQAVER